MSSHVQTSEKGSALVAVLFVTAILFVVAAVLIFQTMTQRVVAANEYDHLAALGHAEAGLTWAEARIYEGTDITDLLLGPDNGNSADDNLFGLRDLSLTSTSQFNTGNEATASAIVQRNFDGQGSKSWEVFRINDGTNARALVYVRLDDNYDDDPDDPSNNDPLLDLDKGLQVTVVAEYPVFVDGNGVEQAVPVDRGRARRTLVADFASDEPTSSFAIASNGDIDFKGATLCGDCGMIRSNQDLNFAIPEATVCSDAIASGTVTGPTGGVAGDIVSGQDPVPLPVINPYDDLYVPSIDVFDTLGDTGLPPGLRCPQATAADPGASKYFALVSNGTSDGEVWKAYWDFGNDRWTWRMIDNLNDAVEVALDDCGRAPGDPNFGQGDAGPVLDGMLDGFYTFQQTFQQLKACAACSSAGKDVSLCGLTDNDFNATGYYPAGGGALVAAPALPGNFQPDGNPDFLAEVWVKHTFRYNSKEVYSPLYGAVIWALSGVKYAGPAGGTPRDFRCSATAGCNPTVLPYGTWPVTTVAVGGLWLAGNANMSPANPAAGYGYQMIAGRDLRISGSAQDDTQGCASGCSSTAPADIQRISGAYATHEQLLVNGNPNIFGLLVAEEAIDCSKVASAPTAILGNPEIFYDCDHPPNPWAADEPPKRVAWQEVE